MNLPSTSLAAVFHGPLEPFELREIPIPALASGTILVEVILCTLCGSDLHTYSGRRHAPAPSILGHETVGRLIWPPQITDGAGEIVRAGERLIWSLAASCGHCLFCSSALPQKCESVVKYGHHALRPNWPLSGGLAEYCMLVPGTFFLGIPENIPDTLAAPATCATATVGAAISRAGEIKGKTVLIMGAGMLGNTACAMFDAMGASQIIVADAILDRAHAAGRFGARRALDARLPVEDFAEAVRECTQNYGADIVLEFAGANPAVERALRATKPDGKCLLVGSVFPQDPLPIMVEDIVRRRLNVCGVYNYAPQDLEHSLAFLTGEAHRYPLLDLVGESFSLRDVRSAFELANSSAAPYRVGVRPSS
jgi:putative phosphonate catabolism associated alcohol dehydrogenase